LNADDVVGKCFFPLFSLKGSRLLIVEILSGLRIISWKIAFALASENKNVSISFRHDEVLLWNTHCYFGNRIHVCNGTCLDRTDFTIYFSSVFEYNLILALHCSGSQNKNEYEKRSHQNL
jgi:hypothetical protein